MRSAWWLLAASLPLFAGCAKDSDGDGISDKEEATLDDDGDGLNNMEEEDLGTDPDNADSDGDGYPDGLEVENDKDPLDAESGLYAGGWPYNADKDDMETTTLADAANAEGEIFPRVEFVDQYGETVDLYDFAGHGKPVMIDVSAIWCGPCNNLASWLSGGADPVGWEDYYPEVREWVENGDVYWVTILFEDGQQNETDVEDLEYWFDQYPDENVPVVNDPGKEIAGAFAQWFPYMILLNDDMTIWSTPGSNDNAFTTPMQVLVDEYEPEAE